VTIRFEVRRIIVFTANMEVMAEFYGRALGLALRHSEAGWRDYDAGACRIALHQGPSTPGKQPPKLVFYAKDVSAARAALMRRGVKTLGKVKSTGTFDMCDGTDPDGNRIQISSRE
jgi:predicted enzyme related to lactoylglutathione lyase